MAGNKFDYLKMLYGDFGKKKLAFKNHTDTIQEHIDGLSESVYVAAKLYREKYEFLRMYKDSKPQVIPSTPFQLEDTKAPKADEKKTTEVSDKIEDLDDKIEASIKEIQYRYQQLNKVIASLSAVSQNYKGIINDIFDTWTDVIDREST